MDTGATAGSATPADAAGVGARTAQEAAQQQEQPQQQQVTQLQSAAQQQLTQPHAHAAPAAAAPATTGAAAAAGGAVTAAAGRGMMGTPLHSLAAAAAVADNNWLTQQEQQQQPSQEQLLALPSAGALVRPAARKRVRSLNGDFGPPAGSAAADMPMPQQGDGAPARTPAEDSSATVSAAAAAAAAAMAAAAEAMRRPGSAAGSLQQHGGWDVVSPTALTTTAAPGQGAAARHQHQHQHQQWKRTRYDDGNLQQLTPQQQHFYQAQQFHLRQQQLDSGTPAEPHPAELAPSHAQQHSLQQQDAADVADAAAAAAAAGAASEPAAAGGSEPLQQSLHNRLQQLLLPELGRQAILQSLDPATQCMVECGGATGVFSVDSERILCLCSSCSEAQGKGPPEFMPSEFERHGGMAACKKWRFSIKVADGGPGMTLGRWLDMRGIQINSYPAKARNSASRTKRPLDVGKALLAASGSAGAGSSAGPTIQLDVSQLLAGLMTGNSQLTGALKNAMAGAQASSTGTAAAATSGPAATGALSGGLGDTAAGSASRLNELAAAVADMLVRELPAAAAAAAGVSSAAAASPGVAAGQGHWEEASSAAAPQPILPHAALAPAATCMWPETAVTTGPGPDDVPLGYAIAAQVASGLATGPGLQQLQQLHSMLAPSLGSAAAGQGALGMVQSTSSATNVLRLPGPGQVQGRASARGSTLIGSQDQLPPLPSGPSVQHSSTGAMLQMLQRHQQAAGQLHSDQLTLEQRLFGAMQPSITGAADQSTRSGVSSAAAGSSMQTVRAMQQPAELGMWGSAAAGWQRLSSPDSARDARDAAAAAAAVQWRPPQAAPLDRSAAPGPAHSQPPAHHWHLHQQQGPAGLSAAGKGGAAAGAAGAAALHGAASTATADIGGSGGGATPAAAGHDSAGWWSAPGVSAAGGGAAMLAGDMARSARGEFTMGAGNMAERGSFRSEPNSQAGMPDSFNTSHAAQAGQGAGLPQLPGGAAAVPGDGATGAVDFLSNRTTSATGAADGAFSPAPAAAAAARVQPGAHEPGPPSTSSADFKKMVGNVGSRLDGLLEDRRRRKQLEEQLAAQGTQLAQLQAELAEERRRRLDAEQQLEALSALLSDKLEGDVPTEGAAAAAAAAAAAPWLRAGSPGSDGAPSLLQPSAGPTGMAEARTAAAGEQAGVSTVTGRAPGLNPTAAGTGEQQGGATAAGGNSAETAVGAAGGAVGSAPAATPAAAAADHAAGVIDGGAAATARLEVQPLSPRASGGAPAVQQDAAAAEQQQP